MKIRICNLFHSITLRLIWIMVLALFSGLQTGMSQQTDQVIAHFDKSFYVTGEIAWYKVYMPPQVMQKNLAIKVMIADNSGKTVGEFYNRTLDDAAIAGYFKIPYEFRTGMYRFFFLANDMANNREELIAQVKVPIYNDLERIDHISESQEIGRHAEVMPQDLQLEIKFDYKPKISSLVTGTISISDRNGNPIQAAMSISVLDVGLTGDDPAVSTSPWPSYVRPENLSERIQIFGTLKELNGDPLQANVLGAYIREENRMLYTKTDPNGNFVLEVPDFYNMYHVQFIGYQEEEMEITSSLRKFRANPIDEEPAFDETVIRYLEHSRMRKKIYQHFGATTYGLTIETPQPDILALAPDNQYDIRKYVAFENMVSFFRELITPLRFIRVDDRYLARIDNPDGRFGDETALTGPPIFMIDGKITRDADFVAHLDLANVERVDLFYRPRNLRSTFNVIGKSGVVSIHTNRLDVEVPPDDASDIFAISGLQPTAILQANHASDPHTPSLNPQLHWMGDMSTDGNGKAKFSFSHTHDLGQFSMFIVARSADGRGGFGQLQYDVEK